MGKLVNNFTNIAKLKNNNTIHCMTCFYLRLHLDHYFLKVMYCSCHNNLYNL